MATLAPNWAKRTAIAWPMPELPPVTRTFLSARPGMPSVGETVGAAVDMGAFSLGGQWLPPLVRRGAGPLHRGWGWTVLFPDQAACAAWPCALVSARGHRFAQRLQARIPGLPAQLALGLARVHDRGVAERLGPFDHRRDEARERHRRNGPRGGLDRRARHADRRQAELACELGPGDDAVARDVVGARRAGGHDAEHERLPDVGLVDELHGQRR